MAGTPIAAYSSSFVLSEYCMYGSGSEGTRPMSAPASSAGRSSMSTRPWSVTRSAVPVSAMAA